MNREPYNEFLLIMPEGTCKGFNDFESAKAYINICTKLGVEEGKCELYKTEEVINKISDELVFDTEKKEIVKRLCEADIDFNIYDNNLDLLISDVEPIDIMEAYGEID